MCAQGIRSVSLLLSLSLSFPFSYASTPSSSQSTRGLRFLGVLLIKLARFGKPGRHGRGPNFGQDGSPLAFCSVPLFSLRCKNGVSTWRVNIHFGHLSTYISATCGAHGTPARKYSLSLGADCSGPACSLGLGSSSSQRSCPRTAWCMVCQSVMSLLQLPLPPADCRTSQGHG